MSIEKRKAVQLARTKKWEMDRTKKCEALRRMCIGVSWWSPGAATEEDPMQVVLAKFHVRLCFILTWLLCRKIDWRITVSVLVS